MQQITCIIKVACFATLIVACFIFSGVKINSGQTTSSLNTIINGSIFLAIFKSLELITGTYGGWDNLSIFAEEDKNPGKNIPRSYFTETDVPQNVIGAFRAKYPSAQVIKWEAEKENGKFYFEAKIKDGTKEKEVHITADGSSVIEGD